MRICFFIIVDFVGQRYELFFVLQTKAWFLVTIKIKRGLELPQK
jgi:hypothetical protein